MSLHILSVVGARPQFVKAAMVVEAVRAHNHQEGGKLCLHHTLLHTGQHYDHNLSDVFFEQMPLPTPDYNLGVGSGTHGKQTGQLLAGIEGVLLKERPDAVMVYGDTNSTLAGALAASKLGMRVAHVEAGLRSFNRAMPEEINRVLTDHVSDIMFCPTETAVKHLGNEGITKGVLLSGDVMLDAVLSFQKVAEKQSNILADLGLKDGNYVLFTMHRAENTDQETNLVNIFRILAGTCYPVVFPVHPRTRARTAQVSALGDLLQTISELPNILMIDPVSYLDMLALESHARVVMTDSGGVQKEAFFLGIPCLTLRSETEWVETLQGGWNRLVDTGSEQALLLLESLWNKNGVYPVAPRDLSPFGAGHAAEVMVRQFVDFTTQAGN
jgi:UDP-N-acetylglucosamine 2-epimerase